MGRLVVTLIAMLTAGAAWAQPVQPAPPNRVEVMVLPPTGDAMTIPPIATRTTPIAPTQNCNLTASPPAPEPLINPTVVEFDDPFTAGRVCRAALPAGLPVGTDYRAVAVFIADVCTVDGTLVTDCRSPRSAVGVPPFSIRPVLTQPVAPTNLVVRP